MRTVIRNAFARQSIVAERVYVTRSPGFHAFCEECGGQRVTRSGRAWLYRFHADDDQGSRQSGSIANGRLFCSRACGEAYIGQPFDETATR